MTIHDYLTAAEAARELGISPRLVSRLAIRYQLGYLLNPRMRLLSPADVEILRNREKHKGRPKVQS